MLKVVGASWLQTRISTCILLAVVIFGVGIIVFAGYGRSVQDGMYSATVRWKERNGYRIEFWGQGNVLANLPMGVARAYYQTSLLHSGWSLVEIETSGDYPDHVQAYAAGLLEGSLTWQIIHHHWLNTVKAACAPRATLCRKMRRYLKENMQSVRDNAEKLHTEDPFWHMVNLFNKQLDGMIDGFRFAVHRNRKSEVMIDKEDFYWLAMASDLPDLERANNGTQNHIASDGTIVLKAMAREHFEPLMALAHNTAAPYSKMLRMIKKYKFAYHRTVSEGSAEDDDVDEDGHGSDNFINGDELVAGQSIVMTSYPGALSSQDESYWITGPDNRELVLAGTPLVVTQRSLWSRLQAKDRIMSPMRIMAANRLGEDLAHWSQLLGRRNSGTSSRQWLGVEPKIGSVGLVEQMSNITEYQDLTDEFKRTGFVACTGAPRSARFLEFRSMDKCVIKAEKLASLQANISSVDQLRRLMSGHVDLDGDEDDESSDEDSDENEVTTTSSISSSSSSSEAPLSIVSLGVDSNGNGNNLVLDSNVADDDDTAQLLAYRGDLTPIPRPLGVIDTKLFVFDLDGVDSFEARSGPARHLDSPAFAWNISFPNASHYGQPDEFPFEPLKPQWYWQ